MLTVLKLKDMTNERLSHTHAHTAVLDALIGPEKSHLMLTPSMSKQQASL